MKKFFKEFKEFISRGNIVDLSVAVIIGGAFSAIVTALTNQIIMPLVNWVLSLIVGKNGLAGAVTILSPVYQTDELGQYVLDNNGNKIIELAKSIYIDWGAFISAIINFLIIAFTIFCLVKIINASKRRFSEVEGVLKQNTKKEYIQEKKAVREQAKKDGIKFSVAWREYNEKKLAEQKAKEEAEKKAKEEAERNKPTVESLLTEIKEILKDNK